MTAVLHLLLALAGAAIVLAGRSWLSVPGQGARHAVAELLRLWRKDPAGSGLALAGAAPGLVLACDAAVLLLVPTVLPALPDPFGNLFAVFGLLGLGRLLAALACFEDGGTAGGAASGRAALVLAASGPACLLVASVVGGTGGSANLLPALAALRDSGGTAAPLVLAAVAVAVLGWADLHAAPGPELFASGRALAVLRVAACLRCATWIQLVSILLPPAAPDGTGQAVLAWAVKFVLLSAGLTVGLAGTGPLQLRPLAMPALAGLLGLLGAFLLALRSAAA